MTCDAYLVEGDTPTTRRYYERYGDAFPRPDDQPSRIARDNFVFIGAVVRASTLSALGGFDPEVRVSSDYDLWIRAILNGSRLALVDEPLVYYRLRPGSLTADPRRHWLAHLQVVERHVDAFRSRGLRVRARAAYDLGRAAEDRGEPREAVRWYLEAARGQPTPSLWNRTKLVGAAARARFRSPLLGRRSAG